MITTLMPACVCSSLITSMFLFWERGDPTFSFFCAQALVLVLEWIRSVRSRRLPIFRQTAMCEKHGGEEVKQGRGWSHDEEANLNSIHD